MIVPVGFRVLVKPDPIEEKSKGGIVVVHDEKLEKANQVTGTLVGVGDIAWKAFGNDYQGRAWAKIGNKVMYSKYSGRFVEDPVTEEEYVILNDDDIVAVITEE